MKFTIRKIIFLLTLLPVNILPAAAQEATFDYQKAADTAKFGWIEEESTVLYSLDHYNGKGEVQIIRNPRKFNYWRGLTIRFVRDNKIALSIFGHTKTVFKVVEDIVYYADFLPSASGCAVVAFDLNHQKQLWRTQLKGMGTVVHSKYHNSVILNASAHSISVRGQESYGDYLEYLDAKSGKTVGHRIFRKGYKRNE